jgi:DNA-binding FrmR family transcriptional regulator
MTEPVPDPARLQATEEERRRILNRLRRLEGQIRGLHSMVEDGKDCDAILTQVMAAKSALNHVGLLIIGHSMKTCLSASDAVEKDEIIDEALAVLMRYVNLPETWAATDQE